MIDRAGKPTTLVVGVVRSITINSIFKHKRIKK